ncbi:hypothetical protein [Streptomyces sp. AJS327]|nr:hypothetical protein [Streptomyces sp. AJS327]
MHTGLPGLGISTLIYGTVGVAVLLRHTLRRRASHRGRGPCPAA